MAVTQLTIYTAASPSDLARIKSAYRSENQTVEIRCARSTDRISTTSRRKPLKPKADIVWGARPVHVSAANGYFEPYAPQIFPISIGASAMARRPALD